MFDHLKPFDAADLAQPWESSYGAGVYGQAVNLDASARTVVPIHRTVDAVGIASMAKAIGALPTEAEAVHLWIGGQHSMAHVVGGVLALAGEATIDDLYIATLTLSKANADEWADLIDRGQVKRLTVLTSVYFEKTSADIFNHAAAILRPRGATLTTLRCHCKLACMRLSDGRTITAEGSANTRSAKTVEQVTVFGSPVVYQFHVDQFDRADAIKGNEYAGA